MEVLQKTVDRESSHLEKDAATMLRILIVSLPPWRGDNNFGSSYTSVFGSIPGIAIANIYCHPGLPDSNICTRYFRISERSLLANLFHRSKPPGEEIVFEKSSAEVRSVQNSYRPAWFVSFAKTHRWHVFFWLRELVWKLGRWRSPELDRFIDEFRPDVIFLPVFYVHYTNDIGLYIRRRASKKMVLNISDDLYTLRQYSLSPLFWINRLMMRRKIRAVVKASESIYVISEKQREEYERIFRLPCKLLWNCGDFSGEATSKQQIGKPVKLVYTGNLGAGRWKSLARIGKALRIINRSTVRAQLEIYTSSAVTASMRRQLDDGRNTFLKGPLPATQVKAVQRDADILVHAESFERKYALMVRLSFSSKIVEYMERARCILAVGPSGCASIDYISANNAGVVVTSPSELHDKIKMLLDDPSLIQRFGVAAYTCGRERHQSRVIKEWLRQDLIATVAHGQSN